MIFFLASIAFICGFFVIGELIADFFIKKDSDQ